MERQIICTDDYGTAVYRCHWTDEAVLATEAVLSGGFYPGVRETYVCVKDHQAAKKKSKALFDESEGNCNTCAKLERVKHDKRYDGFLFGKCLNNNGEIKFHPDDPMHMECYTSRQKTDA